MHRKKAFLNVASRKKKNVLNKFGDYNRRKLNLHTISSKDLLYFVEMMSSKVISSN